MSRTLDLPFGKLPVLQMGFPRPIVALHQIELTSRCNLRCVYCPSVGIMKGKYPNRPAVDMDDLTFRRALQWVTHFVWKTKTQRVLNLAGIGESTIHPQFIEYLAMAREAVGPGVEITFATNGLVADEDFVRAMVPYNPKVAVSLHRPEKAGPAFAMYRKHRLAMSVSADPSVNANTWAGQVEWFESPDNELPCQWLREGKGFVMADGRISTCCLDASGAGVIGHVKDEIGSVRSAPYALCPKCYQVIGVEGWNQSKGCAAYE